MSKFPREIVCRITSCIDELQCADRLTARIARILSLSEEQKNNLAIAVTEAVGNAIVHGNRENPDKKVDLKFKLSKTKIVVLVKDQGAGFNPDSLDDPLHPENLMKESGRGIFILKELMDEVHFDFGKDGTIISMTMYL